MALWGKSSSEEVGMALPKEWLTYRREPTEGLESLFWVPGAEIGRVGDSQQGKDACHLPYCPEAINLKRPRTEGRCTKANDKHLPHHDGTFSSNQSQVLEEDSDDFFKEPL